MITFMVMQGFEISSLRNMYFEEMNAFYKETIYFLESQGKYEKGSYAKLSDDPVDYDEQAMASLRRGMAKIMLKK